MFKVLLLVVSMMFIHPLLAFANEGIVNPYQVYTYDTLKKDLLELQGKFPSSIQVKTIGKTPFGREIYATRLGRGKQNILLIGTHHGREWMTTSLLMEMLEQYAGAYHSKKQYGPYSTGVLDDVSIWFVPMLNPDGVEIQQGNLHRFPPHYQKKIKALNKNLDDFTRWKANGLGVDLNRQYPAGWNELKSEPSEPSFQFYKGEAPLEAKEVKVLTNFTKKISPLIAVPYHSSGRMIFWKYKNGVNMDRDHSLAKKVSSLTNYELDEPPDNATGGGYTDWFITTFKRPALTIEICPLVENTSPPLSVFHEEWERNKYVGLLLANEAKDIKD
ncbi:M14 family zinc carboxypeptidase [Cytobacillus sp. FJAT-54145]|uniref:M14 family zinc carboxypeptidase n=1 Tax=Cytobacillus spartinae TaxID=3299023 RepID=A0ABW6KG58_9BACI